MAENEGPITKSPEPNPDEMIDPFVYRACKGAVNYDRRWAGTVTMGGTVGVWVTNPFNRTGHGPLAEALYNKLKEAGKLPWTAKAFYFTHEQGKVALKQYLTGVLTGEQGHKANKKSWSNKYVGITGVSYDELAAGNFSNMKPEFLDEDTWDEKVKENGYENLLDLKAHLKELYTTGGTTYVNAAQKMQRVSKFLEGKNESADEIETTDNAAIQEIADATHLKTSDVIKVLNKMTGTETNGVSEDEPAEKFDGELNLDDIEFDSGPNADMLQKIEAEVKELTGEDFTEIDVHAGIGDAEDLNLEGASEPITNKPDDPNAGEISEEEVAAEERRYEDNLVTASVTAVDEPREVIEASKQEPHDFEFHDVSNMKRVHARVYSDASKQKMMRDESLIVRTGPNEEMQYFLCYIPELDEERLLIAGLNLIGNPETGQCWLVQVDVLDNVS